MIDADSWMFQQAPMLLIFDVRCVHRPNSSNGHVIFAAVVSIFLLLSFFSSPILSGRRLVVTAVYKSQIPLC